MNIIRIRSNTDAHNFFSSLEESSAISELNLTGIQLSQFPSNLDRLRNLVELYLSSNLISAIPPIVGDLSSSLTTLYLTNNSLETISPRICDLTSLTTLNISDNRLVELPSLAGLTCLTDLHLSHNRFSELPYLSSSVEVLSVTGNLLTSLPPNLHSLRVLYASQNRIETVQTSLCTLSSLRELYLNDNNISTIPPEIERNDRLQVLYLQRNARPIHINTEAMTSLARLAI